MKRLPALCVIAAFCLAQPARAETRTLCLTVLDASSGETLVDIGPACDARVTPATRADYAAAAAAGLTADDPAGQTLELAGDEAFTMADYAAVRDT